MTEAVLLEPVHSLEVVRGEAESPSWNILISCDWQDVVRGNRDHLGVHNTGNVVLKTSQHGDGFIVIDGQQRITTTMLLLTALRDQITTLQLDEDRGYNDLLRTLHQVIFFTAGTEDDDLLKTSRLVPSFYDREPYFRLISSHSTPLSEEVSYQLMAKKCFTSKIQEEVARIKVRLRSLIAHYER